MPLVIIFGFLFFISAPLSTALAIASPPLGAAMFVAACAFFVGFWVSLNRLSS